MAPKHPYRLFGLGHAAIAAGFFLIAAVAPTQAQVRLNTDGSAYSLQVRSYRDLPFRTIVRQQYDYSCGSAALATLLRFHYGRAVDEAAIFKAMYLGGDQDKIRKVGFSLLDMKQYLERTGVKADGYRMTLDEMQQNGVPAITVISSGPYKHFVVVKGISKDRLLIGDPALGLKIYKRADFEKIWNGIVFIIHDSGTAKPLFNRADEWSPWARAPTGERLDAQSLFGAHTPMTTLYQIQQLTAIQPLSQ